MVGLLMVAEAGSIAASHLAIPALLFVGIAVVVGIVAAVTHGGTVVADSGPRNDPESWGCE